MSRIGRCAAISVFLMAGQVQFAACADAAPVSKHEQSAAKHPKEVPTALEKDGQQRDIIPLSEPEIRQAVIGRRLFLDKDVDWTPNKTNPGFTESFFPDGRWRADRVERALVTETGLWSMQNGQICTRVTHSTFGAAERPELCRQVWRDRVSGKIAMLEDSSRRVVLIFSSSPLK